MPTRVATVRAAVMGRVLTVVDRAAVAIPVDVDRDPPAAVRGDAVILRCGGSYMYSTLHFERLDQTPTSPPAVAGAGEPHCLVLDWHIASGDLVVDQLHRGALPIPDLGLTPGDCKVDVFVWGREEAAQYEDEIDEEQDDDFPVGPEVWLLRFWRPLVY